MLEPMSNQLIIMLLHNCHNNNEKKQIGIIEFPPFFRDYLKKYFRVSDA